MTAAELYAAYGNFIWAALAAILTGVAMKYLKTTFLRVTCDYATTPKGRRAANTVIGLFMSIGIGTLVGLLVTRLVPSIEVDVLWFTLGGGLANFLYIMRERVSDADKMALAEVSVATIKESEADVDENDLPKIAETMQKIVSAYRTTGKNSHAKKVASVASGIASAVGVENDGDADLNAALETILKDDQRLAEFMANHGFTEGEQRNAKQTAEIFRQHRK